ncbi:unnamed protein product [Prunus brigantina]
MLFFCLFVFVPYLSVSSLQLLLIPPISPKFSSSSFPMFDFLYLFLFTLTLNFPKLCPTLENPPSSPPLNIVLHSTLLISPSLTPSLFWCPPHIPSGYVPIRCLNHHPLLLGFMDEDASKVLFARASRIMEALFAWVVCPPPFSAISNGLSGYWLPISGGCGFAMAARQEKCGGCSFSILGFFLSVCIGLDGCFRVFFYVAFIYVGLRPCTYQCWAGFYFLHSLTV